MKNNCQHTSLARKLRKEQTNAERTLWAKLKNRQLEGVKFRRQQPIGPYIVDFVTFEKNLVLEIDGGQHNEEEMIKMDEDRTIYLKRSGYQVLRFWDNEVFMNIEGVLQKISASLI